MMDLKSVKMISLRYNLARPIAPTWRKALRGLTALAIFLPSLSFALGLGPITMKSALNQPLVAEINLHSVQKGDLDGLVVKMASSEDFKRISVDKTGFLSRIDFQIKKHADGTPFIQLSTSQNVTEPYLDFLIEARWPRGRALKEYTVLVDPPVLTAEAPAPVRQAQTSPVFTKKSSTRRTTTSTARRAIVPQKRFRPVNKPKPAPIPDPEPRVPASPGREEFQQIAEIEPEFEDREPGSLNHGIIRRNETLSAIALDMKPADVSLQQMMLALLRSNPGAFIDGNINKMRAGERLRIDDPTVLAELSRSDAFTEVARQNRQWRGGRTVQQIASNSIDDDLGESSDFGAESSSTSSQARLKLVAPGSRGVGTGGTVEDSAANQDLREELLLATEALDANKQESGELKGRLSELEEQLESMQRLINLKDQEMASLQSTLKNQQDLEPIPSADRPQQETIQAPEEFTDDEDVSFLSDQTIMALAIFFVVALVAVMVIRRRKMQDGFEESILNIGGADGDDMMSTVQGFDDNSFKNSQAQSVGSMASAFGMSDMTTGIETDTTEVDPISEADVYLAYGRHQQAEDILKQAIQSDDSRLDIHTKLMEVYNAANNQEAFQSHAQFMFDRVGGDESNEYWQKVAQMGAILCPENPLFGGQGSVDVVETAAVEDTALDMSFDVAGDTTNAIGAADEDLLDFEFDMGDAVDPATSVSTNNASANDDNALEFDISSLDFNLDDTLSTGVENVDAELAADADLLDTSLLDNDLLDNDLLDNDLLNNNSLLDDDNALDFDMGTADSDTADADALDFDGLSLDSLDSSDAPIDLVEPEILDDMSLALDDFEVDVAGVDEPVELTLDDDALDLEEVSSMDNLTLDEASNFDSGTELTGEFDEDIFANVDEIGSKLDLAKAYVDMGDSDGARSILDEVMEEGDDTQKEQAQQLLSQMA
ncbi:MAG: FimV/HubP family polar landmark protein [Thiohalomonadales bacterium]